MIIRLMIICLLTSSSIFSQTSKRAIKADLFFDQAPPGNSPTLFAPGIVSDEYGNRDMAISPSGDEIFYTIQYRGFAISVIMHSQKIKGKWTAPEVAVFSGQYNDLEPAFSPGGNRIYFSSNRPVTGTTKKDFDIWYIEKEKGSWSEPKNAGAAINTPKDEFYPSIARSGNIYFTRQMEGKDEDIVMCKFSDNKYDTAISLPGAVNTNGAEFNAFVDPDEQYILFTGYKRKGNIGAGDIFISKKSNGEWQEAKNLGEKVNGQGNTYCPYVSPDKKYFFFTSSRGLFTTPFDKRQDFKALKSFINGPWNGWDNIYWVDAKEIVSN